jgi:DNA-binding beta-propeller fold protein YncE
MPIFYYSFAVLGYRIGHRLKGFPPKSGSNTVTKLRAHDGRFLGTFAVGAEPREVAFDGANMWVANHNSNTVSKLSRRRLKGLLRAGRRWTGQEACLT